MPTIRFDAMVLGSSLGGWIAGSDLAQAGLRVVLVEEAGLAKRPPLLREPFVLTGLESGGSIQRVLRDLAVPLIEQRSIVRSPTALQILLPDARLEVCAPTEAFSAEIARYELADAALAEKWCAEVRDQGEALRRRLEELPSGASPTLMARLAERTGSERPLAAPLPPPPKGLETAMTALLAAISGLASPTDLQAPALLIRGVLEGGFRMPDAGQPFVDLFRRRFVAAHGEIRAADEFALLEDKGEIGIRAGRTELMARALIVAAPRSKVRAIAERSSGVPRWLRNARPAEESRVRVFRASAKTLPVGLGQRAVVVPDGDATQAYWVARHIDPNTSEIEWLTVGGPGATEPAAIDPLAAVDPFRGAELAAIDAGPEPVWDVDPGALLFSGPPAAGLLRSKPLVALVGPEASAGLGLEGEVLGARATAERVAERLGAKRSASPGARLRSHMLD